MATDQALRSTIADCLNKQRWSQARSTLNELWRQQPTPATAGFVVPRFEALRPHIGFTHCKLAILRSYTVEPIVPMLRAGAFAGAIDLDVHVGEFNAYAQEILDTNSQLYKFGPDIVILAIQTRDIAPDLWANFASLSAQERSVAENRVLSGLQNLCAVFRSHSSAHLIVHTLEEPPTASQGVLDLQNTYGQLGVFRRINQELISFAAAQTGVYVMDYDALIARHGRTSWYDEKKWLSVRMPMAAQHLIHLAREWLRFIHPLTGRTCKALVTDLDNTLWGGTIGEEGMAGIKLGPEYPGAAFQAMQRAMLDLQQRGIILAVCSKNNSADAMEALEKHPGMVLRLAHFAALRINWDDKVRNLCEIAAELNLGTDALAFIDDNPVECARVRAEMPEATVIELTGDPLSHAAALRDSPVFERLALSDEDKDRGRHYAEQRQRTELERGTSTLDDFLWSLDQEVEIAAVTQDVRARVAQLTQKTNQFNLTTRRYSEQQILELAACNDSRVLTVRVRDKFGDNGLVGVAIVRFKNDVCEIDTFLLSCRVIGRTVETAFLSQIINEARARGARHLKGMFIPTNKNAPAKNFYQQHGFKLSDESDNGSCWVLELQAAQVVCPQWIRLIPVERAHA